MPNLLESLHSHTTNSDGKLSYLEVLKLASENNIGSLAFTDHDSLPTIETLNLLRKENTEVKWSIGIEVSSGLPLELGRKTCSSFHILGLFIDPTNKELIDHCEKSQ